MARWTFLSTHGRALLCISRDPQVRLRDIAGELGITERRAYAIVGDLAEGGYIAKVRDGRRNRYQVRHDLRLPEAPGRDVAIGEVLRALGGHGQGPGPGPGSGPGTGQGPGSSRQPA